MLLATRNFQQSLLKVMTSSIEKIIAGTNFLLSHIACTLIMLPHWYEQNLILPGWYASCNSIKNQNLITD